MDDGASIASGLIEGDRALGLRGCASDKFEEGRDDEFGAEESEEKEECPNNMSIPSHPLPSPSHTHLAFPDPGIPIPVEGLQGTQDTGL